MVNDKLLFRKNIRSRFFRKLLLIASLFLLLIAVLYFYMNERNKSLEKEQRLLVEKTVIVDSLTETYKDAFFKREGILPIKTSNIYSKHMLI